MSEPTQNVRRVSTVIVGGALALVVLMVVMFVAARSRTNKVALSDAAKPVTVVRAVAEPFRDTRSYVATIEPWISAKVGPQYVSAYVGTVLVRPGAAVKRSQVLATLDCRNASAASKEIAARARALEQRQVAVSHESERMKELGKGGFASENEVEQLSAKTASEQAEVESLKASLVSRSLEVDDCILRSPFDGEVAVRSADPGAYLRPGQTAVTVVDRGTVRISADVPESDFEAVAPGRSVDIEALSTGVKRKATISRRSPAADDSTRTVHIEIDVPNADRALPVGTTAVVTLEAGEPKDAIKLPLAAVSLRGDKATVYVVENDVAKQKTVPLLGEHGGQVYLAPSLGANTRVVSEGRALLSEGDKVAAKEALVAAKGGK